MNNFFRVYACTNAEIVLSVIRIVIAIILLIRVKSITVNLKKGMITIYYGLIFGCLLNPMSANVIIGGIVGIFLSFCALKLYRGNVLINFILFFITIYEILEFVFYSLKIDFFEILETYGDMFVDYRTMYVKLLCSIILSITACIIYRKISDKNGYHISNKIRYTFLGNYFILGAVFAATSDSLYAPTDWKDLFFPLLNVNYRPSEYSLAILEIVILIIFLICRYYKRLDVSK